MLVGGIFAKVSDMRSFASNLKEGAGVLVGLLGEYLSWYRVPDNLQPNGVRGVFNRVLVRLLGGLVKDQTFFGTLP